MLTATRAKENAASRLYEILRGVLPRVKRIGVGTGSTVKLVLERLVENRETRAILEQREVYASSLDTFYYLLDRGVQAATLLPASELDIYFDGADEVAFHPGGLCQAVKGRGAAHTREKILAYSSRTVFLVVDESKVSKNLGDREKPVPVEVVPPAYKPIAKILASRGVRVEERSCSCRDGPTVTDNYGVILDTWPWRVYDPFRYESLLDSIPGVIGHGLFIGYMDEIVVGTSSEAYAVKCKRTRRAWQ